MQSPESRGGAREIVTAVVAFAVAFLVTAATLHAAIRNPLYLHADIRSEKLAMLKQWHGTVFSAVFGSSHVHDGFDPRAFDAALAPTPIATRTANLAIEGGSQSEQRVMALQFLRQLQSPANSGATPQACMVLLELGAGVNFTNDHLVHPRAIDIYDWSTVQLVSHFVAPWMSATQKVGRIGYAVAASTLYYSNVGMLSNAIFSPPLSSEILEFQTKDDRRGEDPLSDPADHGARILSEETGRPATIPVKPGLVTPGASALVEQLADSSPVTHVNFVYIEMPKIGDLLGVQDFPDHLDVSTHQGVIQVPIINLARPDRFPALYDPLLWHDPAHLSGRGAQIASTLLAQQLNQWYAVHGMPHSCGG
jgi:hypothetical protein